MNEDTLPSCPLCLAPFEDPRLLPCGHSICFSCVRCMPIKSGKLECPMCKRVAPCASVDALPRNYSLMETIDVLRGMQQQKDKRSSTDKKCSQHAGQELEFVCITCMQQWVCAKCLLVGAHKGHSHISQEEYMEAEKGRQRILAIQERREHFSARLVTVMAFLSGNISQMQHAWEECNAKLSEQNESLKRLSLDWKEKGDGEVKADTASALESTIDDCESKLSAIIAHYEGPMVSLSTLITKQLGELRNLPKKKEQPRPPSPVSAPPPTISNFFAALSKSPAVPRSPPNTTSSPTFPTSIYPVPTNNNNNNNAIPSPNISSTVTSNTSNLPSATPVAISSNSSNSNSNLNLNANVSSSVASSSVAPALAQPIFLVGGMNVGPPFFDNLFIYTNNGWNEAAPMNTRRSNVTAAFDGHTLYAVGGTDTQTLSSAESYDTATKTWRAMPNMQAKRASATSVFHKDRLWVMGGTDGDQTLDTVELYDPRSRRWSSAPKLLQPRFFHASVVCDLDIYVLGGSQALVRTDTVSKLQILGDFKWRAVASMRVPRSGLTAASIGKSIYAIGGYDGTARLNTAEVYHADEGRWAPIASMTARRAWTGAAVKEGKVYVLGGFDGKTRLRSVECYDPRVDKWEYLADMALPFSVSGFGCAPNFES